MVVATRLLETLARLTNSMELDWDVAMLWQQWSWKTRLRDWNLPHMATHTFSHLCSSRFSKFSKLSSLKVIQVFLSHADRAHVIWTPGDYDDMELHWLDFCLQTLVPCEAVFVQHCILPAESACPCERIDCADVFDRQHQPKSWKSNNISSDFHATSIYESGENVMDNHRGMGF